MQNYTTIIGVIELRLQKQSYDIVQKRFGIGSSTVTLIMINKKRSWRHSARNRKNSGPQFLMSRTF